MVAAERRFKYFISSLLPDLFFFKLATRINALVAAPVFVGGGGICVHSAFFTSSLLTYIYVQGSTRWWQ
jgi:hypothetical protein